jgi:hypothetical protein
VVTKIDPREDAYSAIRKSLRQMPAWTTSTLALIEEPAEHGVGEMAWHATASRQA